MKLRITFLSFLFFVFLTNSNLFAQKENSSEKIKGIRAEIIVQIDAAEKKYVSLAETTPQEKYSYRPAKEVRSIGEVFMHVAYGNYLIASKAGVEMPKDLPKDMEKITEKSKVVKHLKKSFEFARQAVKDTEVSNLDDPIDFFGRKTTKRGVLYFLTIHVNQHLGQSIAYSRSVGIKPPWSNN